MADKLILFNKPFGVLCQFTGQGATLADFIDIPNIYPAGRLDKDSEGLMILTDNGKLQHEISHPKFNKEKTYVVQLEGNITAATIKKLQRGVVLKDSKTKPAKAAIIHQPSWLWTRTPAIRQRKNIPTCWIELVLTEGKNRQVRRMSAQLGFPTLRLIRTKIGDYQLGDLQPGNYECL